MIGLGGLVIIVPTYLQFQLQFYWWGCQKKQQLNLYIYFIIQSDILSIGGDAFKANKQRKTTLIYMVHEVVRFNIQMWLVHENKVHFNNF